MKYLTKKFYIIVSIIASAVLVPLIVFFSREPVLIVAEESFPDFYGRQRIKEEAFSASLFLFRPVKTVSVANDAGDDIVSLAVGEISRAPYCVLFPLRYARAAKLYREQNPQINVVLLEGRSSEDENPSSFAIEDNTSDYFIYKTDVVGDIYRAGLSAAALYFYLVPEKRPIDDAQRGEIAVFMELNIPQAKETFSKAVSDFEEANRKELLKAKKERQKAKEKIEALERKKEKKKPQESKTGEKQEKEPPAVQTEISQKDADENESEIQEKQKEEPNKLPTVMFFNSFSVFSESPNISCVVIVDTGIEYLEKNKGVPVIFFSLVNPEFTPDDVIIVVNDSPWIQAVRAVRKVAAGDKKGVILSKFFLSNTQKIDKSTLRKIKKTW